jgi:branched-chain amino acid transport system permease protein
MEFVCSILLSGGISVGGQYALIAIGYTMVYGILRLINFAHGDVFMVAGLMMVYLSASLPLYLSIPLMMVLPPWRWAAAWSGRPTSPCAPRRGCPS